MTRSEPARSIASFRRRGIRGGVAKVTPPIPPFPVQLSPIVDGERRRKRRKTNGSTCGNSCSFLRPDVRASDPGRRATAVMTVRSTKRYESDRFGPVQRYERYEKPNEMAFVPRTALRLGFDRKGRTRHATQHPRPLGSGRGALARQPRQGPGRIALAARLLDLTPRGCCSLIHESCHRIQERDERDENRRAVARNCAAIKRARFRESISRPGPTQRHPAAVRDSLEGACKCLSALLARAESLIDKRLVMPGAPGDRGAA
jgi:hypothetical protein